MALSRSKIASQKLKTKQSNKSVKSFLNSVAGESRRNDCFKLLELMSEATGREPKLWGDSIVGFGQYHYQYASGREGDWMLTGFSPRKQNLVIYIMPGFSRYEKIMQDLGRFKTGKSCLYVRKLEDVRLEILSEIVAGSVQHMQEMYACS